jgi:hypothetical protein
MTAALDQAAVSKVRQLLHRRLKVGHPTRQCSRAGGAGGALHAARLACGAMQHGGMRASKSQSSEQARPAVLTLRR